MSTRISLTILAMVAILQSVPVWALGLGDARVQSFIGQPLELHIDLLTSPGDDMASVSAQLASAEDFALIGASREAISVPLNFQVREGGSSSGAHILVTSRIAVNNPVLRLVVEVNWSSGRLLREYTIFLDPPTVPSQAPAPVSAASDPEPPAEDPQEPVASAPEPESSPEPAAETSTPPVAPSSAPSTSDASTESRPSISSRRYGPIEDGQTLWQIANLHMGDAGLDMNQVMVAIQRKNPNAFVNGNINLLMRGASLDLPSEQEVNELSSAQARELVAQQEAAFRMRSSLASSSTPLLAAESTSDSSVSDSRSSNLAGSDTSETELASADEAVSRLEIVPASEEDLASAEPGTGAVPGGEGSDAVEANMREELARTEEALISAQQENVYLQERIAELESQLGEVESAESDGLIADDEMSELEDRLAAERLAEQEETTAVAEPAPSNTPQVVTTSNDESDRPWYSGTMTWVIMIVIVLAAVIGWIFNRRRSAEHYELDSEPLMAPVSGLKDEAEEILRTLDDDSVSEEEAELEDEEPEYEPEDIEDSEESDQYEEESGYVTEEADEEDEDSEEVEEPHSYVASPPRQTYEEDAGDATVLDENSSDPEIQLDLARAYISMGDKEAARAILDEVLSLGNEDQKAEAREMMDQI